MEPLAIEFLKARYDAELARCNRLTDSLGLPVAALSVFGSLISVMGTGFSYHAGRIKCGCFRHCLSRTVAPSPLA